MESFANIRCLKCDAVTADLLSYQICGHITCQECHDGASNGYYSTSPTTSAHNPNCPVCQRNVLFSTTKRDQPFPPYFKQFEVIQHAIERQQPAFCEQCSDNSLRVVGTNRCLDCQLNLCDGCACAHLHADFGRRHRIFTLRELQDGDVFQDFRLVPRNDQILCPTHPNLNLTHWCNFCQVALCRQCIRHHEGHDVITLLRHLSQIESYVVKTKAAVMTFTERFRKVSEKHEMSKHIVHDHLESLANCIRSAADERKRKIDRDADRLLQQVDDIGTDYKLKCNMVEEMIGTEEAAANAWTKIMDVIQDGGATDHKLMDFFQFLKANDDLLAKQMEGVREISKSTPKLAAIKQCVFEENLEPFKSGNDNAVGWIKSPILMLVGEVTEEGGIWVLVGDRGRRTSKHQKNFVLPHFLTMMPRDYRDYPLHGAAGGKAFSTIV